MSAPREGGVSAPPALPSGCHALLDRFGAKIRAGLDAVGTPYTAQDVRAVMHEHAPAVAERMAELILLLLPPDEDDDDDDIRLDVMLTAAFDSVAAMLRRCFEEFGPVDEADLAVTLQAAEFKLLGRLQNLADTVTAEGTA